MVFGFSKHKFVFNFLTKINIDNNDGDDDNTQIKNKFLQMSQSYVKTKRKRSKLFSFVPHYYYEIEKLIIKYHSIFSANFTVNSYKKFQITNERHIIMVIIF